MTSFIFRSPKSPTRICQKCSQRLERSQRVQGSDALFHCFRVSLHFLRNVAGASKSTSSGVVFLRNFDSLYPFRSPLERVMLLPLLPKLAPRSLTTYRCSPSTT